MLEVSLQFISQLIDLLVPFIGLYILFDFIGVLIFGRS